MKTDSPCDHKMLTLYHYAELDKPEKAAVEGHLACCADCRGHLKQLQALHALRWSPEVDQAAVMRIEAGISRRTERGRFRFALPGMALGGGVAVVLVWLLTLGPARVPAPAVAPGILTQAEMFEGYEFFENLELFEEFEILAEIEDLG